jgi:hypothetical protein
MTTISVFTEVAITIIRTAAPRIIGAFRTIRRMHVAQPRYELRWVP